MKTFPSFAPPSLVDKIHTSAPESSVSIGRMSSLGSIVNVVSAILTKNSDTVALQSTTYVPMSSLNTAGGATAAAKVGDIAQGAAYTQDYPRITGKLQSLCSAITV
jgi:alpha-L-arabinofuranosidase